MIAVSNAALPRSKAQIRGVAKLWGKHMRVTINNYFIVQDDRDACCKQFKHLPRILGFSIIRGDISGSRFFQVRLLKKMAKDTMKAVVFKQPHEVAVEDRPIPKIKEATDIIVKVIYTALCGR